MNIVLVGYRAAGKSTLGRLLPNTLDMPFLDIDRGIEQRIGKQTLTEFYSEVGEEGFRPIETDVVVEMCSSNRAVIAFGAGSLTREHNQQAATENSLLVYLQVPVAELWQRIQSDPSSDQTRPNLAGGGMEEVVHMLAQREPVYLACADLVVDGTEHPEAMLQRVVEAYQRAASTQA